MRKSTLLSLALIVAFVAGCAHTDEYYYTSHGKAVKEYCPAGILQGHSSDIPRPDTILRASDPYNRTVYAAIKQRRNDLSACYLPVMLRDASPGMFIADMKISATGELSDIGILEKSAMFNLDPLHMPPAMEQCIHQVLSSTRIQPPPAAEITVRVYMVAYQIPGTAPAKDDTEPLSPPGAFVFNTWSQSWFGERGMPYNTIPEYDKDGALTSLSIARLFDNQYRDVIRCMPPSASERKNLLRPISVVFSVDSNGTVSAVKPGGTHAVNAGLEACLVRVTETMEFPPNRAGDTATREYTHYF